MKYFLSYLLIIFSSFTVNAQRELDSIAKSPPSSKPWPKRILAMEKKNHTCVRKSTTSFSARIRKFPFNQAAQIRLISFKGRQIPILNDTVDYSKLEEVKTLTLRQIDSLTDIIYNIGYGGTILIIEEMKCYDPRNAILFVNSKGETFAFIEICFECFQISARPENIGVGDLCDEKFSLLKRQFLNAGILYGTKILE